MTSQPLSELMTAPVQLGDDPLAATGAVVAPAPKVAPADALADRLKSWFGIPFAILSGETGELLVEEPEQPCADWGVRCELCRAVASQRRPAIVAEEDPFYVLAIPFVASDHEASSPLVAVSTMVSDTPKSHDELRSAESIVGTDVEQVAEWAARQPQWPSEGGLRLARLAADHWFATLNQSGMATEIDGLSEQISHTYEEISLIYRLTQNLKLGRKLKDLGKLALLWLEEVISAEGMSLYVHPPSDAKQLATNEPVKPLYVTHGRPPVDRQGLMKLIEQLGLDGQSPPYVANEHVTRQSEWAGTNIRQLIVVPLCEGQNLLGWLAAFNHTAGEEFGSVEANLMNAVASILGVHHGNHELYRQQAELLAGVIRALSSAIDAKDPYTCGHSDRVARIAVTIAREMGADEETVKTLYLGGLLHDVGKIGIQDEVLRKPGRLTDAEYDHIKSHPEIGYRILVDLKKLGEVLPIVRYHHEAWDGRGYPAGMSGEEIPFVARLVAVADAFDAMASDRPYRRGMDDEKLDTIFRGGAGTQWDPDVIEAMFRVRDKVGAIARESDPEIDFQWATLP